MSESAKREIKSRILSIICTFSFLVISTMLWYNYRDRMKLRQKIDNNLIAMADKVSFKEETSQYDAVKLGKIEDSDALNIEPYKFSIKNNSNKVEDYLIFFKDDNDKDISNNYIKYRIKKDDEEYSDIRNLAIDGKIYLDRLNPLEESSYSIQYWIDSIVYDSVKNSTFDSKISLINDNY